MDETDGGELISQHQLGYGKSEFHNEKLTQFHKLSSIQCKNGIASSFSVIGPNVGVETLPLG